MNKFKKTTIWLKENFLNILVLGIMFFCIFNIFNKLDDSITVITNSLAIFITTYYFIKLEGEKVKKIIIEPIKYSPSTIIKFLYKKRWKIISLLFLFFLLLITLNQFTNIAWIKKSQTLIMILTIVSGGLTFWHYSIDTEKEKDDKEKDTYKKTFEFFEKYPKINKIPILRNIIGLVYKEGWKHILILFFLLIIFVIVNIKNIQEISIGTDEGNIMHAIKISQEGLILYKDFWFREPGSFLILKPLFNFLEINLTNYRLINLIYNLLFLILLYLTLKKVTTKKITLFSMAIYVLSSQIFFPIYAGSHRIYFYPLLGLALITLFSYLKNPKIKQLILLSLLSGLALIMYKKALFLIAIILGILLLRMFSRKEKISNIFIFYFFSMLPTAIVIMYLSFESNLNIVINYMFKSILTAYILFFLGIVMVIFLFLSYLYFLKKIKTDLFNKIEWKRVFWICSLIGVLIYFLTYIIQNVENASLSFWSQGILPLGFFIMLIFLFNAILVKRENKYVKIIFFILLIAIWLLIIFFVEQKGIIKYSIFYNYLILILFTLFIFSLIPITLEKHDKNKQLSILYTASIILNISIFFRHIGFSFSDKDFNNIEGRITIIAFTFPIFLALLLKNEYITKKLKIIIFIILTTLFLTTTHTTIKKINNSDLVLYRNQETYKEAIEYINNKTKPDDYIFTGDLALASQLNAKNIINITSPWSYRNTNYPFFCGKNKTNIDFCISKQEIATLIKNKRPIYIILSNRATEKTFLDSIYDKNNKNIMDIINKNYILEKRMDIIYILRLIK